MILLRKAEDLQNWLEVKRKKGLKVGFVPTMGALHNGHISLLLASKANNNVTVSSIFVNPTQFNNAADFDNYPITIESDIQVLEKVECEALFLPSVAEIYPNGYSSSEKYDLGNLETILEGKYRPGHYQGVCKVVQMLLEIVMPDNLYLGQKDFQQCMVINKLIDQINLSHKIKVNICPTLRENDGLAMSSRNMRLNNLERSLAASIYQTLLFLKKNKENKNPIELKKMALATLIEKGFIPDYVEIADELSLAPVTEWNSKQKTIALVAASINEIRLIDNLRLD